MSLRNYKNERPISEKCCVGNVLWRCRSLSWTFCQRSASVCAEFLARLSAQHVRASSMGRFYHWRELPQVSFVSRQTRVCRKKTRLLLRQKFCGDKHIFLPTKLLLLQTILSRQNLCCDKLTFVATNMCLSRQNTSFVSTKVCLSRQKNCLDKKDTYGSSRQ